MMLFKFKFQLDFPSFQPVVVAAGVLILSRDVDGRTGRNHGRNNNKPSAVYVGLLFSREAGQANRQIRQHARRSRSICNRRLERRSAPLVAARTHRVDEQGVAGGPEAFHRFAEQWEGRDLASSHGLREDDRRHVEYLQPGVHGTTTTTTLSI